MLTEEINEVIQALSFCLLACLHVGALMKTHFEDSTSLMPKTSTTLDNFLFFQLPNFISHLNDRAYPLCHSVFWSIKYGCY